MPEPLATADRDRLLEELHEFAGERNVDVKGADRRCRSRKFEGAARE